MSNEGPPDHAQCKQYNGQLSLLLGYFFSYDVARCILEGHHRNTDEEDGKLIPAKDCKDSFRFRTLADLIQNILIDKGGKKTMAINQRYTSDDGVLVITRVEQLQCVCEVNPHRAEERWEMDLKEWLLTRARAVDANLNEDLEWVHIVEVGDGFREIEPIKIQYGMDFLTGKVVSGEEWMKRRKERDAAAAEKVAHENLKAD